MMIEDRYPDVAGFKEGSTSRDAAEAIEAEGRAPHLRAKVRRWFESGNTGTADECAASLGEGILAIRPRVSELRHSGFIKQTGERRRSAGGRSAHVWQLDPNWRAVGEIAADVVEQLRQKMTKSSNED